MTAAGGELILGPAPGESERAPRPIRWALCDLTWDIGTLHPSLVLGFAKAQSLTGRVALL